MENSPEVIGLLPGVLKSRNVGSELWLLLLGWVYQYIYVCWRIKKPPTDSGRGFLLGGLW